MLWKETRAPFRCRCRASLIGCAAFLLYSRPLINQCWQGRGFVCHIAGTNVCQGSGAHLKGGSGARHPAPRLQISTSPLWWISVEEKLLDYWYENVLGGLRGGERMGSRTGVLLRDMRVSVCVCVCVHAVVAIIYLAYPSLTCPPTALSSVSEKRVVQRKDEDTGRRQSEPGLSPGETHSAALHEILFIIILTGLNVGR